MKIGIIGAGISGLSAGQLLGKKHDVEILEKESKVGGIARTKKINNISFHTVGGHCFNSKNSEVMKFIFSKVLAKSKWHKIERKAKISFKNNFIDYPIEFSIKQIANFDKELAYKITSDFFNAQTKKPKNLAMWFEQKFGKTLAREYFIPYNRKIWNRSPKTMSHLWIKDKLPIPNKQDFFQALLSDQKDNMPHAFFYYPNTNDQNTFLDALARNLKITTNYPVKSIVKKNGFWLVNDHKKFDLIICTAPLNQTPFILKNCPAKIKQAGKKLKYNKVATMLWQNKPIKNTWTYYPEKNTIFHRHIHIGNFSKPRKNYTITEVIGVKSEKEMKKGGRSINYLKKPVAYHVSDHAYVVYDNNYKKNTQLIKTYLKSINFHILGRFGEWQYYNMDKCIESAMQLAKKIK